jgi:hypothetical protein
LSQKSLAKIGLGVFLPLLLVLGFQNCTQQGFKQTSQGRKHLENGGPYAGKTGEYRYFSPSEPCSARNLKGEPLPNEMLLFRPNSIGVTTPVLTREACVDVEPVPIPEVDVQFDETTDSLVYRNRVFAPERPGDFDIVAAGCPAGKSAIPGAVRQNLFASAFDWTVPQSYVKGLWTPGWYNFPGIGVDLYSTISSLPAFLIQRNDPNQLDIWRRSSQHIYLQADTQYAFTFLARPGSVPTTDFTYYRGLTGIAGDLRNEEVVVTFDFQNRTTNIVRTLNIAGVSAVISPLENGFICTVYFTTSATANQGESNIGIAPVRDQGGVLAGDSILATAAQLVPVDQFCQ